VKIVGNGLPALTAQGDSSWRG